MKRKRVPIKWPDGARIAVTPCVAFETWPEDLGGPPPPAHRRHQEEPGDDHGPRVRRACGRVPPAGNPENGGRPDDQEAVAQGHEIGTENWIHDYSYMKRRDVCGRPFRAPLLREFIRYAKGHSKVWFARAGDSRNGTGRITGAPRSRRGRTSPPRAGPAGRPIWSGSASGAPQSPRPRRRPSESNR